ncbi:MAG: ABC transporter substrate-binding protein, partial [Bacteroidetes bacterium]|nr:ABC transporter substrate-binding protein [Bacteroidota bacterium]
MLLDKATSFNKQTLRIISLVPSQTELLYHLGLEEEVAGITKFCIHPDAWHKAKPRIGGTKNINISKIKNLSPTLIIANKEENVKEQITLLAHEYDVWVTDVNNLQDALQMI